MLDLRESWRIGPVEIPSRLVLAPMAGVSVQAFRRQGRRFGAGLVCSEMVSCAGIEHRNERTLGYLRVGADEHPLAIQIFGSDPRGDGRGGADGRGGGRRHRRHQLRLPRAEGDEDRRRRDAPRRPRPRACRIVAAVAGAVDIPVSVKMRRGLENGSRRCLEVGPRLVEAGAQTLTLHPRSAKQMYTGEADHSLTAELVELVDVPVIASGDVTSRARAQAVLATTGAAAVMVGRAAQGNPWALREMLGDDGDEPTREEVVAELVLFMRETVRELGERRASGFLKKFYGWYLGRGRFPRPFKQELVQLDDGRGGRGAAVRGRCPARDSCWRGSSRSSRGGRGAPRRHADLDLRRRMTESLRGQLLVASPALIDPNFRRTVVLVVAHDEDGAVGLVLNRPTDAEVAEAVPELGERRRAGRDRLGRRAGPERVRRRPCRVG